MHADHIECATGEAERKSRIVRVRTDRVIPRKVIPVDDMELVKLLPEKLFKLNLVDGARSAEHRNECRVFTLPNELRLSEIAKITAKSCGRLLAS